MGYNEEKKMADWAQGEHQSPYGPVKVRWERSFVDKAGEDRQEFIITGSIPANTDAVLVLPDGSEKELGNGSFLLRT